MKKATAREILLNTFTEASIEAWLDKFPDDYEFDEGCIGDFIDYINSVSDNPALHNTPEQ